MSNAFANAVTRTRGNNPLKSVALVVGGSLFVALLAQISIPVPFSPVPITGQSFGVLLIGLSFGSKKAVATIILYLLAGLAGLPVFSGGTAGLAALTGKTAGYLAGFILAAGIVGYMSDRRGDLGLPGHISAVMLGHVVIFACGLIWLAKFVGSARVVELGLTPFVPGMIIKSIAAGLLMTGLWRLKGYQADRPSSTT